MKSLVAVFALFCATAALAEPAITRIAFGSCASQTKAQPIWEAIVKQEPELFLFIGDAIYADFDGKEAYAPTEETLKRDWGLLGNEPHYKAFSSQVPVMATWDNHDYGKHDGGAEFELKDLTKQHFLDFFQEPQGSERRRTPGIYDARVFGPEGKRVQVILLDTRWFKGPALRDKRSKEERQAAGLTGSMGKYLPNNDPEVTLLGSEQWRWLETQLQQPAEMRLIVSGTQVIADQKHMDEWGNYPLERQRLFDLIVRTQAQGVIILSGNVHFAELSKLDAEGVELYDFTSSGLTHTNAAYAAAVNPYRVAGPYDELNFGMVEIDWEAKPSPVVRLVVMNSDSEPVFEHRLPLSELRRH